VIVVNEVERLRAENKDLKEKLQKLAEIEARKTKEKSQKPLMKIEVVVDKDNTHMTYMYECDKVKDYSSDNYSNMNTIGQKLVLLKNETIKAEENQTTRLETIAVFSVWTSWTKLPDGAEKCERCARYRILNVQGYCQECFRHLRYEEIQKNIRENKWKPDTSQVKSIEKTLEEIEEENKRQKREDYKDDDSTKILIEEECKPLDKAKKILIKEK
jgi:hypothetical protein